MAALQIIALDTTTPQLRAPASGDTYAAPRALAMTPETLTGSSATSALAITQTWNTSGTPTAIDLNVTDTASNVSSLLMNLRVGGSSAFNVTKAGVLSLPNTSSQVKIILGNSAYQKIQTPNSATFVFTDASNDYFHLDTSNVRIRSGWAYGWSNSSTSSGGTPDLFLARDAANTLAQRNGVNAQAFNVYSSYTDGSNFRRVTIGNSALGSTTVYAAGAGTGLYASLILGSDSGGSITVGANATIAANQCIINAVPVLTLNTLTIASGAVTVNRGYCTIDTEASAATDDLDTINGGSAGQLLIIRAANSARTVVAKDGTGNLKLNGDFSMDNAEDTLMLIYDGSNWLEVSRSDNGA